MGPFFIEVGESDFQKSEGARSGRELGKFKSTFLDACMKASFVHFLSGDLQFSITWNSNTMKDIKFNLSAYPLRDDLQEHVRELYNSSPFT